MEDKEKEISEKKNDIDSTNEIEKIDELKDFIMGEYKEAILNTIEINNLKSLRERIYELDTKYGESIEDLREEIELIKKLGEKISTIDTKYSDSIERLKDNEIKNLDTKYSDVLGKFDELKDKIIEDKDKRIGKLEEKLAKKEVELEENKASILNLTQKLEQEKANNQNLNERLSKKEVELESKSKELEENKASILNLTQKLEQEKASNQNLTERLSKKEEELENKRAELEENKASILKLTQELEQEKANNQNLTERLSKKEAELEMKNNQLTLSGEENERIIVELKKALNNFYGKIEKPYENLLRAIEESKVAESIGNYLGFNNEKGLSKSMILFALASDDNLARKVAMFYLERKEILEKEDFRIIEEVNNIYTNKPWGILYAEPEGIYQSSLVKDRKSSSIYRNFTAMYSPAYRPDETGNSPIKGIVDGK